MSVDRTQCPAERHGTEHAYSWGKCRCSDAREAYRLYRKRLREGRQKPSLVDPTGTARRLQALVVLGYNKRDLAQRLGSSHRHLHDLINKNVAGVKPRTAQAVKDLFRSLAETPGSCPWSRTVAARNGWVDAAAWDDIDDPSEKPKTGGTGKAIVDEVKVQRALHGEQVDLLPKEKRLAVEILTHRGHSQREIAGKLGISPRRVCSHRSKARQLSAA